jgi:protein-S-isoprenylcysteine O-methyltransferase Ste14
MDVQRTYSRSSYFANLQVQGGWLMNNLFRKAILGFIQLLVILGILLFLPAGSIKFWQAWVYLAVFFGCAFFLTVYLVKYDQKLLESRLNAVATGEKEKSQKIIQAFVMLFSIGLFVTSGLDFRFQWSQAPVYATFLANIFVALGFLITFFVFRENSYASAIIEVADEQPVISTGPYGIVRHPMYAGALLLFLFTPIALGSFWALLFFIPLSIVIVLRLLDEEKFLSENLPGYQEYCQKIQNRLVPLIW